MYECHDRPGPNSQRGQCLLECNSKMTDSSKQNSSTKLARLKKWLVLTTAVALVAAAVCFCPPTPGDTPCPPCKIFVQAGTAKLCGELQQSSGVPVDFPISSLKIQYRDAQKNDLGSPITVLADGTYEIGHSINHAVGDAAGADHAAMIWTDNSNATHVDGQILIEKGSCP